MAKLRGGKKNAKKNQKQHNTMVATEKNQAAPAAGNNVAETENVVEEAVTGAEPVAEKTSSEATPTAEPTASEAASVEPKVDIAPSAVPKAKATPIVTPATATPASPRSAEKHVPKAKPKLPSWLAASAKEMTATHAADIESAASNSELKHQGEKAPASDHEEPAAATAAEPASVTVAPATVAPAMAAPADDGMLLGAPMLTQDDDGVDALLAPTQAPAAPAKPEAHPLAGIVGGFTAPLAIDNNEAQKQEKAKVRSGNASSEKLKDEVEHLNSIINSVESLDYLKPRMKKIALGGCEMGDLVGLYRMVSQVLLDNMRTQIGTMRQMRERYEKKLRQIVVEKSADFVKMVAEGKRPTASETQSSEPIEGNFMLRKQLEIKEELLLKAREAQADAEARYDKIANDVANIRQRQEKDLAIRLQKAQESLFNCLLPTLDSLDSAVQGADSYVDAAAVVEGLKNIQSQLLSACQAEGLQPIEAKGEKFDPNFHEALGSVTTNDVPEDTVVVELRRGYTLNDKLLRATMVQVARPE